MKALVLFVTEKEVAMPGTKSPPAMSKLNIESCYWLGDLIWSDCGWAITAHRKRLGVSICTTDPPDTGEKCIGLKKWKVGLEVGAKADPCYLIYVVRKAWLVFFSLCVCECVRPEIDVVKTWPRSQPWSKASWMFTEGHNYSQTLIHEMKHSDGGMKCINEQSRP